MKLRAWLDERIGARGESATVPGPSFAYVLGWTLVILFIVEAVTGAALSAFYAPSTTDAWASVAYVQDRMAGGWFVRGLHHHAAAALVIVSGAHLLQTAIWGAYRRPRELTWWIGILLMLLVLAFAITGYVLRWDQSGYWANQVEVGIAAGTPILGPLIKSLVIGGNEYGNLTLTRFYALHIVVLPAIVLALVLAHIKLARRHGVTPRVAKPAVPRWPQQTFKTLVASTAVLVVLFIYTAATHGADLASPADPSAAFDARPLWYFRWLFALRMIAGSAEQIVAMVAPAIVVGFWIALPLIDRGKKRVALMGTLVGFFIIIGALTATSYIADGKDEALAKRLHAQQVRADRARALAAKNGVPITGAQDVFTTVPMYRARTIWAKSCSGCHDADSKDRKGPIITVGHGNRQWLMGFLKDPSGDAYWRHTKLAKTDDAMKPVDLPPNELDDLVEVLYAQSGATDVDAAKRDRGKAVFEKACTDCHSLDEGVAGGSGPGLGNMNSRDWFTSFIGNPKAAVHMGPEHSEMPRFDRDLSIVDRDSLAEYLVWLRNATAKDALSLGPL